MNKSSTLLLVGACAAGLVTGIAGKRLLAGPGSSGAGVEETRAGTAGSGDGRAGDPHARDASRKGEQTGKNPEQQRSSDSIDSLLEVNDGSLYQRLALWLMDASEEEIAAYWDSYQKKDPSQRSRDIADLVFLNWARLNPRGAIARAGPRGEQFAWWAWACHDPKASLAAATAAGGDILNHVTFGLGEFHPDWLREHISELPEEGKRKALQGMLKWDDQQDPLATLQFMKENGIGATTGNLKALARHDPEQALAWVREQGRASIVALETIIDTLASDRPEDLQRLAAEAPSGNMKLKMEAALFKNLIETDPAAALKQAEATTVPRIAADRYAALGMDIVGSDPEKAFAYARELFSKCPEALRARSRIIYPNGSSGYQIDSPATAVFTESLLAKNPDQLLGIFLESPAKDSAMEISRFSDLWATRDLAGYTDWVNRQSDSRAREAGASTISTKLAGKGHFQEAAEWAMNGSASQPQLIERVITGWASADRAATSEWIESSELPPARKATLRELLKPKP